MKLYEKVSSLPGFGLQQSSSAPFEVKENQGLTDYFLCFITGT